MTKGPFMDENDFTRYLEQIQKQFADSAPIPLPPMPAGSSGWSGGKVAVSSHTAPGGSGTVGPPGVAGPVGPVGSVGPIGAPGGGPGPLGLSATMAPPVTPFIGLRSVFPETKDVLFGPTPEDYGHVLSLFDRDSDQPVLSISITYGVSIADILTGDEAAAQALQIFADNVLDSVRQDTLNQYAKALDEKTAELRNRDEIIMNLQKEIDRNRQDMELSRKWQIEKKGPFSGGRRFRSMEEQAQDSPFPVFKTTRDTGRWGK